MWDLILAPINWLENHPAVLAWLVGWTGAISAGQLIKHQAPLNWDPRAIERLVQVVTVVTGALVAWMVWPKVAANRATFALVVGMSAPLAYTWAMALLRWKFRHWLSAPRCRVSSRSAWRSSNPNLQRTHSDEPHSCCPVRRDCDARNGCSVAG